MQGAPVIFHIISMFLTLVYSEFTNKDNKVDSEIFGVITTQKKNTERRADNKKKE